MNYNAGNKLQRWHCLCKTEMKYEKTMILTKQPNKIPSYKILASVGNTKKSDIQYVSLRLLINSLECHVEDTILA